MNKPPSILFENRKRARRVRLVLWLSITLALTAIYSGWVILNTYGLAEADGGVLKPFNQRLLLSSFIALIGFGFAGAMMLFASHYLLLLENDGDKFLIKTMTPWGIGSNQHKFSRSELGKAIYEEGRHATDIGVHTPWIRLSVSGRRLPFILDLQAENANIREILKRIKRA